MISINISELIWTVINFFLLLFLLNRFLYKPVIQFMTERQARIDAGLRKEQDVKASIAENEERILADKARSREEAKQLLAEAKEEIERHQAEVLCEAKQTVLQNTRDAETVLDEKREETAKELLSATPELAALLAKRLLSEE